MRSASTAAPGTRPFSARPTSSGCGAPSRTSRWQAGSLSGPSPSQRRQEHGYRRGGREYTFKLREGMKWSDGKPFTADDIVFAYEDVLSNEDLTPDVPLTFLGGDEPAEIESR